MFNEGLSSDGKMGGKNKYTPKQARDKIQAMRLKNGLLKFSSTSDYGDVPKESQIRSFWARYKQSLEKELLKGLSKNDVDEWVDAPLFGDAIGDDAIRALSGSKFYVDGTFSVDGGADAIKDEIIQNGGRVGKTLTKGIGKFNICRYHLLSLSSLFPTFFNL